jgi:Predicted membrane protein
MDWKFLFTSFDGRISRKTFWIGTLILIVAWIVVGFVVLPIFGASLMPNPAMLDPTAGNVEEMGQQFLNIVSAAAWANLVMLIIFAYPMIAVMIKRRHDRNNAGTDVYVYLGLLALLQILQALGLCYTLSDVNGVLMPTPTLVGTIAPIIVGIFGLYLLVVMGFLRGDAGPNTYGPDPLGGTASATA